MERAPDHENGALWRDVVGGHQASSHSRGGRPVSTAQVTPFDLNPNINYSILPNPAARATALAQPTSVVFDPSGQFLYVAAFGTDRVAQVDTNGHVMSFVEVSPPRGSGPNAHPRSKRGPRGLALNAEVRTLYVLNRISNSISVIDTVANSVIREIPVGTDATPLAIRIGRGFLYDAKLSGNGTRRVTLTAIWTFLHGTSAIPAVRCCQFGRGCGPSSFIR